ncbi:hypothetical protein WR25_19842 [Diploscapter pachys]|uniref:G-protein coupled receptors family 1 profile domain-containing protein n=1 Tax=Diploscapter pachys TaxID=2018661 RepID=A0A2A2KIA6_9BILA|nr:hypothetical protein WR25_19842 [Diploscapter pachys]
MKSELGVVGNLLVVISVCQHRALHSVRNIFIVSLSCSDIVVSIVSGSVTSITAFTKIWLFGPQLCYLVPLIQGTSLCFSTLTLTAIAIDRFILIIYPTRRPIQRRHAFRMVAFNCTVALAISFPMFLKQKLVKWENFCGKFCTEDWGVDAHMRSVYGTLVLILQFAIPLVIITFCYSMISLQLSKVGVFFCCWVPSVAFNFLRDYGWLPEFVKKQEYFFGVITHCISMR